MTIGIAELARSTTLAMLVLLPAACDDESRAPPAPGGSSQRSRAIGEDTNQSDMNAPHAPPVVAAGSEPVPEDAGARTGSQGREATRLQLLDVTGGAGASGSGGSAGFAGFGGSGGTSGIGGSGGTSGIGGFGGTSGIGGFGGTSGIGGFGGSAATGGS